MLLIAGFLFNFAEPVKEHRRCDMMDGLKYFYFSAMKVSFAETLLGKTRLVVTCVLTRVAVFFMLAYVNTEM